MTTPIIETEQVAIDILYPKNANVTPTAKASMLVAKASMISSFILGGLFVPLSPSLFE